MTLCSELSALFNNHGHALASADTEGGQTEVDLAPLHVMDEGDDQPGPCASDGMPERDPASVYIRLFHVEFKLTDTRNRLGSKGFVQLNQADVIERDLSSFQSLPNGRNRTQAHIGRIDSPGGIRTNRSEDLQAQFLCLLSRHEKD